ncbi:hypothetical protein AGR8A_pAt20051 [Agrobacterium fabrum str. J-07]|nr:hypothetical protein AGR8A_pAt20051 [Agrobacterium fabrum str. J-07]
MKRSEPVAITLKLIKALNFRDPANRRCQATESAMIERVALAGVAISREPAERTLLGYRRGTSGPA